MGREGHGEEGEDTNVRCGRRRASAIRWTNARWVRDGYRKEKTRKRGLENRRWVVVGVDSVARENPVTVEGSADAGTSRAEPTLLLWIWEGLKNGRWASLYMRNCTREREEETYPSTVALRGVGRGSCGDSGRVIKLYATAYPTILRYTYTQPYTT